MNGGVRFFLDTNIFTYSFDAAEPGKSRRAGALVRQALEGGQGVTSYQVAQELCSAALRTLRTAPRPADLGKFLDAALRPLIRVESSLDLLHSGLWLHERYRLSWYDALIVAAAQQARCAILYSEDFQHGQVFDSVRVVDPFR